MAPQAVFANGQFRPRFGGNFFGPAAPERTFSPQVGAFYLCYATNN